MQLKHPQVTSIRFPEKLKEKYRKLDDITYDFLTPLERQFVQAQVEEAKKRTARMKTA